MDNIGNPISVKKISDTMTSNGRNINVKTVESYLSSFLDSYIIYQAERYDIKGKDYLKTLGKYYLVDVGLRHSLLNGNTGDEGHILENVIFLELLRRGYHVYVGKMGNLEVDFVAMNKDGIKYIQVAATVLEESTLQRELKSLKKINDNYPKCIMTLDRFQEKNYEGIRVFNALDYLLHEIDF